MVSSSLLELALGKDFGFHASPNWVEERMIHGLSSRQTFAVIVHEEPVQQIYALLGERMVVVVYVGMVASASAKGAPIRDALRR
jgi:hypothetical protein